MANAIKIGIWGGGGSGKTTFLAALRIALLKYAKSTGTSWSINGLDEISPRSSLFLEENTRYLQSMVFPPGTLGAPATYTYEVNGSYPSDRVLEKAWNWLTKSGHVQFNLDVFDYPGGYLITRDANDSLWEYLAGCDGLIYLFDPDPKKEETASESNFAYLQRSLDMMRRVFERSGSRAIERGRLPQHLAFCITKYDDVGVFKELEDRGFIDLDGSDETLPPFLSDPEGAFELIADELTIQTVRAYFRKDRIKYFGTTSVGFYVEQQTRKVDMKRFSNIKVEQEEYVDEQGQTARREIKSIKSKINPIGVIEPVLWLHRSLSARP
jgi:hypothetical protein